MLSNRTAKFFGNEKEERKNSDKNFLKLNTTPIIKFDMNFHFKDEEFKEASSFSFRNDLLSNSAYFFIKRKDKYLTSMILDDTVPN